MSSGGARSLLRAHINREKYLIMGTFTGDVRLSGHYKHYGALTPVSLHLGMIERDDRLCLRLDTSCSPFQWP